MYPAASKRRHDDCLAPYCKDVIRHVHADVVAPQTLWLWGAHVCHDLHYGARQIVPGRVTVIGGRRVGVVEHGEYLGMHR